MCGYSGNAWDRQMPVTFHETPDLTLLTKGKLSTRTAHTGGSFATFTSVVCIERITTYCTKPLPHTHCISMCNEQIQCMHILRKRFWFANLTSPMALGNMPLHNHPTPHVACVVASGFTRVCQSCRFVHLKQNHNNRTMPHTKV